MAYKLNDRLKDIKPYEVSQENCKIRLDANESFIDPCKGFQGLEGLKDKLLYELSNISLNRYPDDTYRGLRQAFGNYYNVDPELVVAGNGSDELIALIIGSFLQPEDKLLLAVPDFSMYSIFASTFGKTSCVIDRSIDGGMDFTETLNMIEKEKVTALIFSNPSSAFSTVMEKSRVLKIVDNTDALVVVDEAYMDFSDQSVLNEAAGRDNLVVLKTCSKALGCAGIRLGFAVSSSRLTNVINGIRPPYNLNSLSEATGRIVMGEADYLKKAIAMILENRDELYNSIITLKRDPIITKVYPTATNYICIESGIADKIYRELRNRSILIRNIGNMLRITVGTKSENTAVFEAMREICLAAGADICNKSE